MYLGQTPKNNVSLNFKTYIFLKFKQYHHFCQFAAFFQLRRWCQIFSFQLGVYSTYSQLPCSHQSDKPKHINLDLAKEILTDTHWTWTDMWQMKIFYCLGNATILQGKVRSQSAQIPVLWGWRKLLVVNDWICKLAANRPKCTMQFGKGPRFIQTLKQTNCCSSTFTILAYLWCKHETRWKESGDRPKWMCQIVPLYCTIYFTQHQNTEQKLINSGNIEPCEHRYAPQLWELSSLIFHYYMLPAQISNWKCC